MTTPRLVDRWVQTPPHVLIVVQNLPVPMDRRVWLESLALVSAGYRVSVICPKGPGDPRFARLNGVDIYKYRPPPSVRGVLGFVIEFAYCWMATALLSLRVHRSRPFDVLQACNPPDTYWALARLWKWATGGRVRFLFDHHDLNPEVFLSRFGAPTNLSGRALLGGLRALEQATFRTADHVTSTNESYRSIATGRGGVQVERTTVVRSGPDTAAMRPVRADPARRPAAGYLAVWLGIMGPQDGVDIVLRAMAHYRNVLGRNDMHVALLGFGDSMAELQQLAIDLGVDDAVTFTGRVDRHDITVWLSTADFALCPDPSNPLNDKSTMNKTMEYMAFALPVVASDLGETRVSAGDCARYVTPGDPADLAAAMAALADDPSERERLGVAARHRVVAQLDWQPQARAYVGVLDGLTGFDGSFRRSKSAADRVGDRRRNGADTMPNSGDGVLVDLRLDAELHEFARTRFYEPRLAD